MILLKRLWDTIVMALINKTKTQEETVKHIPQLTKLEYEFLFSLIKNSTFKGEQLELLYNLTVKLQAQYLNVKDNE
jgi:hypothetical protein